MGTQAKKKIYKALVWQSEPNATGKQVTVRAESLEQARLKLENMYGKGTVFDLHTEPDLPNTE